MSASAAARTGEAVCHGRESTFLRIRALGVCARLPLEPRHTSAELKTPTSGSTGITQERPDWSARGRPQRAPCSVPSEATERGWRLRHREGDKYRCAAYWAARDGRRTTASASRRRQRRDGGRNIWAAGAARGVRSAGEGRINGSDGTNWAGVGITSHAAICVMVTRGRVFEHALAGVGVW